MTGEEGHGLEWKHNDPLSHSTRLKHTHSAHFAESLHITSTYKRHKVPEKTLHDGMGTRQTRLCFYTTAKINDMQQEKLPRTDPAEKDKI